jgi:serine/threonine protein kinase
VSAQLAAHAASQTAAAANTTASSGGPDLVPTVAGFDASTVGIKTGAADLGAPTSFPSYELLGIIGRGGMGVVYKARSTRLGRVVAIKTITELDPAQPDQSARFQDEAQAAARLQHPNIIALYEIGEHQGRPYLVQEFVDGGDLRKLLASKPMEVRRAAELLEILARAVHAAHAAGIVHRDLKPGNILLTAHGVPKVADFGLAKLLGSDFGRTRSGQVLGTPSYMAPEQADGRTREVGPRSDVYALGASLYEMLTGRPPFLGNSQLETLRLVCATEPVAPRRLRPDIPIDLETICLKCLDKDPRKRYESADALADELRRFLDHRPITARPVGPTGRLWRWSRRNPWVAGLSASVAAALIVGILVSTVLMIRATRAERMANAAAETARKERDRAEEQAKIAMAVNTFLNRDLLAQASAYSQFTLKAQPDPDLKVRTALERAAAQIGHRFAGQPLVEASIRKTIGEAYLELGLYPQAQPHLMRALELHRRARGDHDPDTLVAMRSLGALYLADGKFDEARSFLIPAQKGLLRTRGGDDPETLAAMHALAELDVNQEVNLPEAAALMSHVQDALVRTRGAHDHETLGATNSLAMVLLALGKSDDAERLLQRVVADLRAQLTADHPLTLTVMYNLAQIYDEGGNKQAAEQLWNDVLSRQRKVLGNGHPHTLLTITKLAFLCMQQSKLHESEPLFIEAVNGCRAALDRNHQTAAAALGGLAAVYAAQHDLKKLGPVLIEAREITRVRYGPEHPLTMNANQAAGMFFLAQQDYAQAEPYFRDCFAFWVHNDPESEGRILAELRLGVCALGTRNASAALPHLTAVYNRMKPRAESAIAASAVDLGQVVSQITRLGDSAGPLKGDPSLVRLRSDPSLQAIVLDLAFPADPFAR